MAAKTRNGVRLQDAPTTTSQNELHPSGSPHKADRDRDPLVEIALAASGHQPLALGTRARMLRGKSNGSTLAVMPLVACPTPTAAHHALCSRSRYDSACRFAAANSLRRSIAAKRTGRVQYHHARPNSAPKNSLQRRAIPQSCDQSGGTLRASSSA